MVFCSKRHLRQFVTRILIRKKAFPVLMLLGCSLSILRAQQPEPVKFGLGSDIHLPTMHDSGYRLRTFLDAMRKARPDFIIELGDFGTPAEKYRRYFDMWDSYPGEAFHVIGNHEMDGGFSREEALAYRGMEKGYYSFDKNDFHFIVLDGNDPMKPGEKGYKQFIGPEQRSWLETDLATAKGPTVIFSHQGLIELPGADESYGVTNSAEIRQILEAHNLRHPHSRIIACFNGHAHYDDAQKVGGIWYVTVNSMAYKWLGEDYEHLRYSQEVDRDFRWIKFTAPYAEPLFCTVEILPTGLIKIKGRKSVYVGPSPWKLGFPKSLKKYVRPAIKSRKLRFKPVPTPISRSGG